MSKKSNPRVPMGGAEFKQCLESIGLSEYVYSEVIGLSHGTVNRRVNDKSAVPPETAILVRLLASRPELLPLVYELAGWPETSKT
jgi:plasmid maintenance system antidote protein VapI